MTCKVVESKASNGVNVCWSVTFIRPKKGASETHEVYLEIGRYRAVITPSLDGCKARAFRNWMESSEWSDWLQAESYGKELLGLAA